MSYENRWICQIRIPLSLQKASAWLSFRDSILFFFFFCISWLPKKEKKTLTLTTDCMYGEENIGIHSYLQNSLWWLNRTPKCFVEGPVEGPAGNQYPAVLQFYPTECGICCKQAANMCYCIYIFFLCTMYPSPATKVFSWE